MMALASGNNNSSNEKSKKDNDSYNEMIKLAENFVQFIKICQDTDEFGQQNYKVVLSTDTKTSILENDLADDIDDNNEFNSMSEPEVVLIDNQEITLSVVEAPQSSAPIVGPANSSKANAKTKALEQQAKRKSQITLPKTFTGYITITAVETRLAMDRDMIIEIKSSKNQVAKADYGSFKLPMLCAIEKELAKEFAQNLLSRLRVQMKSSDDPNPVVVAKEAIIGGDDDVNFGHFFDY